MPVSEIEQRGIDVIRGLAMDAVQKANSGHPGTPMALAPLAHVLFTRIMRYDASAPDWPDRDRFVLSAGHASMLLYSSLYLCGYGLTLDDLKNFRQLGSPTAGHPEYGHAEGIETTTGPLGQGMAVPVQIGPLLDPALPQGGHIHDPAEARSAGRCRPPSSTSAGGR